MQPCVVKYKIINNNNNNKKHIMNVVEINILPDKKKQTKLYS